MGEWASGRWQAAHRGVYVAHSGPVGRRERRWIAALAAGAGRVAPLGGLSALETLGFRGLAGGGSRAEGVHILVPARLTVRRAPAGGVVHRTSVIDPGDIHRMGSPPGTMPARSPRNWRPRSPPPAGAELDPVH